MYPEWRAKTLCACHKKGKSCTLTEDFGFVVKVEAISNNSPNLETSARHKSRMIAPGSKGCRIPNGCPTPPLSPRNFTLPSRYGDRFWKNGASCFGYLLQNLGQIDLWMTFLKKRKHASGKRTCVKYPAWRRKSSVRIFNFKKWFQIFESTSSLMWRPLFEIPRSLSTRLCSDNFKI